MSNFSLSITPIDHIVVTLYLHTTGARGNPYTNCGSLDQCQDNPCGLNARCFNEGGSYRCECAQGFQGNPSQQCLGEKTALSWWNVLLIILRCFQM